MKSDHSAVDGAGVVRTRFFSCETFVAPSILTAPFRDDTNLLPPKNSFDGKKFVSIIHFEMDPCDERENGGGGRNCYDDDQIVNRFGDEQAHKVPVGCVATRDV